MKRGKLIIIDGIDGAGKSVQAKILFKKLKKQNRKVNLTQEPQDKNLIKLIKENEDPVRDLLLFLTDRRQHYQKIVKLLFHGFIIICDRSFPSTLAYQYYASGLKNEIKENFMLYLDHLSRFHLEPDLVLILDVDPEIACQRLELKNKKTKIEKFEKINFLRKVREGYLYFAKKFGWEIIDASKSLKEVHFLIEKVVQSKLKLLK